MNYSFFSHFLAVQDRISNTLLASVQVPAIRDLCSLFPFDAGADFGFETRLGDPQATCDFFMQIRKKGEGPAIFGGKSKIARLSPMLLQDPVWTRLSALFAAWTEPGSILEEKLELFWLEFDYHVTSFNKVPSIFFKITESGDSAEAQRLSMIQVLDEMYRILFGIPFPSNLSGNLKMCYEALPTGAKIYQTGFMIPRKAEAVRCLLSGIKATHIARYLKDIGWAGEVGQVEDLTGRYASKFDKTTYNIHIGSEIMPALGMEMFMKNFGQPRWEPLWSEIFDLLETDNLVLENKAEGLMRFPGIKRVSYLYPIRYINGINHLKLVSVKGSPPVVKGYFGTMINPDG